MTKKRSFAQKSATYWAVIRNNPNISSAEIGRRYKGTNNGMRKEDRDSLVKELKGALTFSKRINNSNASRDTKERLTKASYNMGKNASKKGRIINPPDPHQPRFSMKQVLKNTFSHAIGDKFEKYEDD